MTSNEASAAQRARRRRRAVAAVICVFLGGASLGAAVGLTYTRAPRRQYEKAFDSIGLTAAQRHATDSIMSHYACALDSINRTIAPEIDSVRRLARQEILEVLSESQITRLNRAIQPGDGHRGQRHSDKRAMCDHGADTTGGHSHFLKL
jgi:hypothetical protein